MKLKQLEDLLRDYNTTLAGLSYGRHPAQITNVVRNMNAFDQQTIINKANDMLRKRKLEFEEVLKKEGIDVD